MTLLDIILTVILLFGFIRGFMNGLFVEIASLLALVVGVYGAINFSAYTATLFEDKVDWQENYVSMVAFAITFIVIVLTIALAGKAFTKLADFAALGITNKILGGLFGILKLGLIASVVLMIFKNLNDTISIIDQKNIDESMLYEPVLAISTKIYPAIKAEIEKKKEEDNLSEEH